MTFILIVIICLVVWYYVLPYLLRRQIKKTFGFDPRRQHQQQQQGQRQKQPRDRHSKKKKIDPTVGEYVEFTETTERTETTSADGTTQTTERTEQQITDVQWEDLPNTDK